MCRLYGFRSTLPRKVECELIRSQNSLIAQSRRDEGGKQNAHGWGLAAYVDGQPYIRKQPRPAFEGEDFRWTAAEVFASNVLAHVRRATVAPATVENTHPFIHDKWTFIHNGEIVAFEEIRSSLLDEMTPTIRASLEGDTDSEYVFRFLLSLHELHPEQPLPQIVCKGIRQIEAWVDAQRPGTEVSLNILMSNGAETVGTRLGRSLWFVKRDAVHQCEVCGGLLHTNEDPGENYRAVVVASERLTKTEDWHEVPNRSVILVNGDIDIDVQPFGF